MPDKKLEEERLLWEILRDREARLKHRGPAFKEYFFKSSTSPKEADESILSL